MTQPVPTFAIPTFEQLQADTAADFTNIPGADITLRYGVTNVMSFILAKLAAGEYLYLSGLINRALIPTLMVAPYLDVFCAGVGITREGAAAAGGTVQFNATPGIPLPSGALMQDSTGQVILATTASVTGATGTTSIIVPVVAATLGSIGNLPAGAPVTLQTGVAGIQASGIVASPGLTGGVNAETDAALQTRLQARLSLPPQGGASYDYVSWAKLVSGVTRVWVFPLYYGPGTVVVQFTTDGRANPLPLSADITAVQNQINAKAPVIGTTYVQALAAETLAVTLHNLTPATGYTLAQAQANVTSAIAALNYTTTPGGLAWDSVQQNYVTGGMLQLQTIYAAIANAPGVGGFDLVAPTADTTATFGNIVQLAAPTFT